jgi:disulfide bond formation protein DsbB
VLDTDTVTTFFLVLTVAVDVLVVGVVVAALAAVLSPAARTRATALAVPVGRDALAGALVVAVVGTTGSLYYSLWAGYVPCELCWYQRILMYPLVVVLGVGLLRRDRGVRWTALPFVVLGTGVSTYHWLVERVPSIAGTTSCSAEASCAVPYFERLGFVTLAWMSLSGFLVIGALLVLDALADAAPERKGART